MKCPHCGSPSRFYTERDDGYSVSSYCCEDAQRDDTETESQEKIEELVAYAIAHGLVNEDEVTA